MDSLSPRATDYRSEPTASRLVRPYALTGGRTRSVGIELAIEALVARTGVPPTSMLSSEQQLFLDRSDEPISLAELAAYSRLPIGVTRVLVGDLCSEGVMKIVAHGLRDHRVGPHSPDTVDRDEDASTTISTSDVNLLERVLHGLRAL
ncbi:MAG: multi-component regulatory system-6 [Acidimicrobiia bacterium]|nr:multi-component regulatory system-6 [Acidimicrobiia bacterium]